MQSGEREEFSSIAETYEAQGVIEGKLRAHYSLVGDDIAHARGWQETTGIEAIHRFLIDKYHWLPVDVRALTLDDFGMLLDDPEIEAIRKTAKARRGPKPPRQSLSQLQAAKREQRRARVD